MEKITIKQLEAFLAVVENGSFTLAAEKLYMTQSTVSIHVATLESELMVTLLNRENKKKITMTQEGRIVYSYAQEILGLCNEMEKVFTRNDDGKLKIGASSVPSEFLVPDIMSEYLKKCKGCSFILQKGDSTSVHDMLVSRQITIGFVGSVIDTVHMNYYPVFSDRLVMITPNNEYYFDFKQKGITGDFLLNEPMIVREKESGSRKEFEKYLIKKRFSVEKINIVAEIEQPTAIIAAVSGGIGTSIVSYMAAEQAVKEGKVLSFELGEGLNRDIYMVIKKNINPTEQERNFIDFVLSELK